MEPSDTIKSDPRKKIPIFIYEEKWPNVYKTMIKGLTLGHGLILTYDPNKNNARKRRRAATAGHKPKPGHHPDEYPYATTKEGGQGAAVNDVPEKENLSHGGYLGFMIMINNMQEGDQFIIIPIPKKYTPPKIKSPVTEPGAEPAPSTPIPVPVQTPKIPEAKPVVGPKSSIPRMTLAGVAIRAFILNFLTSPADDYRPVELQ